MNLPISIALRAEQDIALQYGWYLENSDVEVAERYLHAIDQTLERWRSHNGEQTRLACCFRRPRRKPRRMA